MAIEFSCPACGRALRSDEQYQGRQTRCPACSALATIPTVEEAIPDLDSALQLSPVPVNRDVHIAREPQFNTCPECGKPMNPQAVICIECGYDRRHGQRLATKVRRFEHTWNTGIPMPGRVIGVLISSIMVFFVLLSSVLYFDWNRVLLFVGLFLIVLSGIVNFGTFNYLSLVRTKSGRLDLTRRAFFAFIPFQVRTVDLRECEELRLLADESGSGVLPGFTGLSALALGLCTGWLMGMIWYVLQSSKVHMTLRLIAKRDRDSMTLYSGTDDTLMRDIVDTLQGVTNMPLRR